MADEAGALPFGPPVTTDSIVGIGRLELIRFAAIGVPETFDLRFTDGSWLAWMGGDDDGDLIVVHPGADAKLLGQVEAGALRRHEHFHGAAATRLLEAWWTPPPRVRRMVGRVQAIRYDVPDDVHSDKAGHRWHHKLGDFGREGGGDQSADERYWPNLHASMKRPYRWWIQRRRENRYRLSDWLIG